MKQTIIFISLLLQTTLSFSQIDLYIPLEFQQAYKNQTRSIDGKPGKNYWQNYAEYKIEAEVIPGSWQIIGNQTVEYTNNSPDSLSSIILKAYPNHYKMGSVRDSKVRLENLTNGMIISELIINGDSIDIMDSDIVGEGSTLYNIHLKDKIPAGSAAILQVNWTSELPKKYKNRMGAYDSSAAFMAYWYPQIAVYDDIDGWDRYEYLGTQEFYRGFADFDVKLKVPADYQIWATGELQNSKEVLIDDVLNNLNMVNTASPITVSEGGFGSADGRFKTWHFKANNVQDFAAGISNNFMWSASSVSLSDKTMISNFVFDINDTASLKNTILAQNSALEYFSHELPGIPYPYPHFTTFVGVPEYDGMEFPMMANNGALRGDPAQKRQPPIDPNDGVTIHELAHTYFPFYVGINEVKYSWMEEGMVVFLDMKYNESVKKSSFMTARRFGAFNMMMGRQWESPLFSPSNHLVYRYMHSQLSYIKPAIMYYNLQELLGEDIFLKCLQAYIKRWAGKHPTPFDFIYTFNDVSGQNLNWFWKPWIFEFGYADLAVKNMKGSAIQIEKVGVLPVSIHLLLSYEDGNTVEVYQSAAVWEKDKNFTSIKIEKRKSLKSVEIISAKSADVNPTNNKLVLVD